MNRNETVTREVDTMETASSKTTEEVQATKSHLNQDARPNVIKNDGGEKRLVNDNGNS